jgi:hypothetical protein
MGRVQRGILTILSSFLLTLPIQALDDFDLAKYGPDDTIEVGRTQFIVKLVLYANGDRLNKAFEEQTGEDLPEGSGIRGFAVVAESQDVCFVHIEAATIWDDREAMAIMGHEVYHCALSSHKDLMEEEREAEEERKQAVDKPNQDIEDLYAEDRRLELEWLKDEYEKMGIIIDAE